MKFTVLICGRGENPHVACFEEIATAMTDALRALGHEVTGVDNPGRIILFGAGNLVDVERRLPPSAIIYNAEQVGSATGIEVQMKSFATFRERGQLIWDYSQTNIAALRAAGLSHVVHCPVGYMPSMTKIDPATEQDIDILFYGSMNQRRREILTALKDAGLNVVYLFGAYDAERDDAIARAKVVLNLHYYDKPIFEIFRVSHLLANRKCVVSEDGGCDPELEAFAARATELVSRERFVDACMALVEDEKERRAMSEICFQEFRQLDFVEHVRRALAQS